MDTMVSYRGHELKITKLYYKFTTFDLPENIICTLLYTCNKCSCKCYNVNLNYNDEAILTCEQQIIKDIIE